MKTSHSVPLTKESFDALQEELKRLIREERPKVIQAIAEARGHGDLSENAEYDAAKNHQSFLEGRPHIVDAIKNNEICMVINTTQGAQAVADSFSIRRNTLVNNIAYYTTTSGARAAVDGIIAMRHAALDVKPIQEYLS